MAKFLLVLLCLVVIQATLSLKCKRCKDNRDTECKELEDETCPSGTSADKEPACLTLIFKDDKQKMITEKRCVIKTKDKEFQCQIPQSSKQEKCLTCNGADGCNKDSAAAAPVGVGALAVIATVMLHRLL